MNKSAQSAGPDPVSRVVFPGEEAAIEVVSISQEGATVRLPEKQTVWVGRFLALKIGDLPAVPGDIREVDGLTLTIVFRTQLHPSVLAYAMSVLQRMAVTPAA